MVVSLNNDVEYGKRRAWLNEYQLGEDQLWTEVGRAWFALVSNFIAKGRDRGDGRYEPSGRGPLKQQEGKGWQGGGGRG